jgi:Protein of unknown function (DUF3048).
MSRKRKAKKTKITVVLVLLLFIVGAGIGVYKSLSSKDNKTEEKKKEEKPVIKEEIKKLQIVNEDSDSRNVAVMYNNISNVWGYQSGLQDAYIVYEIIVEGGYTRLMAIFKDAKTERIGSVRSSRPYYLDYVLENDANYVHYGGSTQAYSEIKSLKINNIDGMSYAAGFWRDKTLKLASEHTAFTSMERIKKGLEKYKYRTTTTTDLLLNYSVDEIDISGMEGAIKADSVYINYSNSRSTTFEYDNINKVYLRSQGTAKTTYTHTDYVTKNQYTTKNIITYQVENYSLDSYGRQALKNIGGGSGYYITDGYAVPITWEKTTRSSQTVYRYLNGKEIVVNDGNTYIQIQPKNRTLTIK